MYKFHDYEKFTKEDLFDFSKQSTIGCGGVAKYAFFPQSQTELISLIAALKKDDNPYFIVGNLSNVLPPDGETQTAVVGLKYFHRIREGKSVFVQSGCKGADLLRYCVAHGKSGAEFLVGIPCTIGGALYMNAGVGGRYISDIVESVTIAGKNGVQVVPFRDCAYGYKTSRFMQTDEIILGANLRLEEDRQENVRLLMRQYAQKRANLPKGKSMGCVFKNPAGISAGALIERSGLKGVRFGGAVVSKIHANFIINEGATSSEIKQLISFIKERVQKTQGITLQEEIRYFQ